jgi:hypothetical protein
MPETVARSHSGLFLPLASVEALYRHCHLRPPVVVTAGSAVQFARSVAALARVGEPGLVLTATLIALPCLPIALATFDLTGSNPDATALRGLDIGLVVYVAVMSVALTAWYLARLAMPRRSFSALIAGYASGAASGALAAAVLGGDWRNAVMGAAIGGGLVSLAQVVTALTWSLRQRRAIGQRLGARIALLGSRPIHDVVRSRLDLAARNLPESAPAPPSRPAHRSQPPEERPRVAARIEAEGRRLTGYRWSGIRPLLGSGSNAGDRYSLDRAARQVADPDDLPAVLRAAIALDASVDAVTLLEDVTILLPSGSPLEVVAAPRRGGTRLRSERAAYRDVLAALGNSLLLRRLVDLAWSDRIADRLLARHIVRSEDSVLRQALVQAMGTGRFIAAARLAPVHTDETGALYLVGPARDPLAYVRVEDATPGADGTRAEHWLRVPPHVATAREAVAWTFGVSEQTYSPTMES